MVINTHSIFRLNDIDIFINKIVERKEDDKEIIEGIYIIDCYGNVFSNNYLGDLCIDLLNKSIENKTLKDYYPIVDGKAFEDLFKENPFIGFLKKICCYIEYTVEEKDNIRIPYDETNELSSKLKILFNEKNDGTTLLIQVFPLNNIYQVNNEFKNKLLKTKNQLDHLDILFFQVSLKSIDGDIKCIDIREFDILCKNTLNPRIIVDDLEYNQKYEKLGTLINNTIKTFKDDINRIKYGGINEIKPNKDNIFQSSK